MTPTPPGASEFEFDDSEAHKVAMHRLEQLTPYMSAKERVKLIQEGRSETYASVMIGARWQWERSREVIERLEHDLHQAVNALHEHVRNEAYLEVERLRAEVTRLSQLQVANVLDIDKLTAELTGAEERMAEWIADYQTLTARVAALEKELESTSDCHLAEQRMREEFQGIIESIPLALGHYEAADRHPSFATDLDREISKLVKRARAALKGNADE